MFEYGRKFRCAQSVRNRAARDHSGPHQSRDASRCKLQKILMRLGLEKSSVTLKIRRGSPLVGVQLPLPAPLKLSRSQDYFRSTTEESVN